MLPMLLTDVVLTKSQDWDYEKEIRFFRRQEENFVHYNPKSLKGIIVGRRTTNEEIEQLSNWINEFNEKNETSVKILFAHRVATKFNLGIHSNKGFRDSSESSFNARIPVLEGIDSEPLTTIKNENEEK